MASIYKRLNSDDVTVTSTNIYEAIPIVSGVISGSYSGQTVKTFSHGMFQSIYDYPYLSASANHLFDVSVGRTAATEAASGSLLQADKKKNIYTQMAQLLVGYDTTGSIKKFDDKNSTSVENTLENAYFLSFSRLLVKDEIKAGSFNMVIGTGSFASPLNNTITITDLSATTSRYADSPTGEYGILTVSGGVNTGYDTAGLIFYQAGVVALSPYIFAASGSSTELASLSSNQKGQLAAAAGMEGTNGTSLITGSISDMFVSASIQGAGDALRRRIKSINFNNTTELNSTIYFCRANSNEFNYSSNPTYLSGSEIIVKAGNPANAPVSYITTVGLYSVDNELLAVAKLSEPLKKTPDDSIILRTRLDV